jgi:DNA polymerase III psi subunit
MNKLAYLDVMGVSRWKLRDCSEKPYVITLDEDDLQAAAQPFVNSVLTLLGVTPEQCDFRNQPLKDKAVVWDLRRVKSRPRVAWLSSEPLAVLMGSSEAKRALWQQICAWQASRS